MTRRPHTPRRARRAALAAAVSLPLAVTGLAGATAAQAGSGPSSSGQSGPPAGARFSTTIDNPFLPFVPGTRMIYRSTGGGEREREVVRVTHRTRVVDGVTTRVVRDKAYVEGELVEDTRDFYAQDRRGNVWYFGEFSQDYENGQVVNTHGSWLAGRDGARAGIVMKAHPKVGDEYAQEVAPGVAEDRARVLSRNARATTPYGSFRNLLKTRDWNPLEPGVAEHKKYLRGVGSILEKRVKGGKERLVLVRLVRP